MMSKMMDLEEIICYVIYVLGLAIVVLYIYLYQKFDFFVLILIILTVLGTLITLELLGGK